MRPVLQTIEPARNVRSAKKAFPARLPPGFGLSHWAGKITAHANTDSIPRDCGGNHPVAHTQPTSKLPSC